MKIMIVLLSLVLVSSISFALNVSTENINLNPDGTAKPGTFYVNNTIINESDSVIYSTNTSATTNTNGKFKKVLELPYFGNSTLRMRVILDSSDSGYQQISYVPYSVNSQYLQGQPITYFASLVQVNALIAANGNWSDDKLDYYTATEVNNGFYTKAATDILLGNKLDSVDQRYNDSSLIVSVNDSWKSNMSNTLTFINDNNNSMKGYIDIQDNLDYKTAGGTISGDVRINANLHVQGNVSIEGNHLNVTVIDVNNTGNENILGNLVAQGYVNGSTVCETTTGICLLTEYTNRINNESDINTNITNLWSNASSQQSQIDSKASTSDLSDYVPYINPNSNPNWTSKNLTIEYVNNVKSNSSCVLNAGGGHDCTMEAWLS